MEYQSFTAMASTTVGRTRMDQMNATGLVGRDLLQTFVVGSRRFVGFVFHDI